MMVLMVPDFSFRSSSSASPVMNWHLVTSSLGTSDTE